MLNPLSPLPLKDPTLFRQANYLDGKWVEADGRNTIVVKNPATFEAIGEVPAMGTSETRRAIEAANRAFPAWRAMLAKERRAILRKLADLMLENTDDLGVIMTAEQGKPLSESKGEIAYAASFIEWFADEALRIYGDTIPQNAKGRRILVTKEPIGVFAAITPWNFPCHDHPQSRSRLGRRLHGRDPAGQPDAVLRAGAGRAGRTRRHAARRVQRADRPLRRHGRGTHQQQTGAQTVVHRLDRSGRQTARPVRADHQENLHGTGRQRALHRVRRRRPRRRGARRDGQQIPQHRANLRLRQPLAGAGRRIRRLRRKAESRGRGDESRQRHGTPASARAR